MGRINDFPTSLTITQATRPTVSNRLHFNENNGKTSLELPKLRQRYLIHFVETGFESTKMRMSISRPSAVSISSS